MESNETETPVCVVTGGTSGIGNHTVKLFAGQGYRVATCGRNETAIAEMRSSFSESPGHWITKIDLNDVEQARNFAEQTLEKFGRVDVLINNAATAPLAPFADIEAAKFEELINTNLKSAFYLTQIIWRKMLEQGRGAVVNISSLAAIDPFPGFSIYGASKAWADLLTTALASEGQDNGINVYSIRAGAVETPLLRRLFPDFPADQCVSPESIAQKIWQIVSKPDDFNSGDHIVVANQT